MSKISQASTNQHTSSNIASNNRPNYACLLSQSWSGSTLASMLITSIQDVIGFGDTYFKKGVNSPKHTCTCGEQFYDCDVRKKIKSNMESAGHSFSWDTLTPGPSFPGYRHNEKLNDKLISSKIIPLYRSIPHFIRQIIFKDYYEENTQLLHAIGSSGGYSWYLDGCKNIARLELLRTRFPETKAVHLIRHPCSFLYHFYRLKDSRLEFQLNNWFKYHKLARSYLDLMGKENYLLLKYEDMVKTPTESMIKVHNFLNIPHEEGYDAQVIDLHQVHILGNKMRESFFKIEDMSEKWKGELPNEWVDRASALINQHQWLKDIYS